MHTPIALPNVTIRSLVVSDMENNVYILTSRSTGHQVVVDAADDAAAIGDLLADALAGDGPAGTERRVEMIITTHRHWDHVRALGALAASTGARTAAGADDCDAITEETGVRITSVLRQGEYLDFDGYSLQVVHLRGHTPGSVALVLRDGGETVVLAGDSLFPGGPGKTRSPADFASLMDDLESRVFGVYPDSAIVLPGHGDSTTVGAERPHVGEWRERGW